GGDPAIRSFVPFKILWCVMSAATSALAYLGIIMMFSRRVGLAAAALSVFSFGGYGVPTSLNNETPYALCVFAAIVLSLQLAMKPAVLPAAALALVHGLAMLLRAEHPLLLIIMAAWLLWRWRNSMAESKGKSPSTQLRWPTAALMLSFIIAGA